MHKQRKEKERLSDEQRELLDKLGFIWQSRQERDESMWQEMFQRLLQFKHEFDHVLVPQKYEEDPKLGEWVSRQRVFYKDGRLLDHRKQKLESVGFAWTMRQGRKHKSESNDERWNMQYQALVHFKERWGHCMVPFYFVDDPKLYRWVEAQRRASRQNKISRRRKKLLDKLGFVWEQAEADDVITLADMNWDRMYERLLDFRNKYEHVNVPQAYRRDGLGDWVMGQRTSKTRNTLAPDRVERLNRIGFIWRVNIPWEERFENLKEFNEKHGHFRVSWSEDSRFARWVNTQRYFLKSGKLNADQVAKLKSIGFK